MSYFLFLSVFILPIVSIFTKPMNNVWYSNFMALIGVGFTCASLSLWKFNKLLSVFMIYLTFSYLFVSFDSPRTLICFLTAFGMAFLIYAVSLVENRGRIYRAIVVMSLLSIAYSIAQNFNFDPFFRPLYSKVVNVDQLTIDYHKEIVSFMGSPNQLGVYHAGTAFFSPFLIPLSIIPIFLCKCTTALIGLICGALVYGFFRYGRKTLIFLAILALLAPIWFKHNHKTSAELMERVNLWKLTIQQTISGKAYTPDGQLIAKCNPLFGYGLGNFFNTSWRTQNEKITDNYGHVYEHAHFDLIEAFWEFGYAGFAIVLLLIGSVILEFILAPKTYGVVMTFSSLIAQAVSSYGTYVFHAPISLFMICLTLGLFYGEVEECYV